MIYSLNETPVKTSVNYGLNNIKVEIDIDEVKQTIRKNGEFSNVSFETEELDKINVNIDEVAESINSKIGLALDSYKVISIEVPDFVELKTPVIIDCLFDDDNQVLIDNVKVKMGKNAKANFIFNYASEIDSDKYFHYLIQETDLADNAECNIIISNLISSEANSFIAVENNVNENAKLTHTLIELGGNQKVSNYYTKLSGDDSKNFVKNIYLGNKNNLIDINYNIDAIGKRTKCNIESQGAIAGKAKKNFKGVIDFKEGSTKSNGVENENCMILSEEAKSKSLPMLLCHEEDVYGEHGVSSGKPDESKLFYIMTKGISYDDARKLLVRANFNNIIKTIDNENLKDAINNKIEELIK